MNPLKSSKPMTSILQPQRPYVNASRTNVAETFARIRAEQAQQPKIAKVRKIK